MGTIILRNIEMTLDPESIQNAINEISELNGDLVRALDALTERLLKNGVMMARMKLRGFLNKNAGLSTGELSRSIHVEMENGSKGYLVAGTPGDSGGPYSYAVYFEFGFGTGSHYRKQDGSLIKTTESVERHKQAGLISHSIGRLKDHPSGRDVYRDMESFPIRQDREDGPEYFGWVYKDRRTGKFYISKGQNPKPFMYETFVYLSESAEKDGGRFIAEYIA